MGGTIWCTADWKVESNIGRKFVFPLDISTTNFRPDMITSSETKKVIIVELTVPWETVVDEAHARKLLKYNELVNQCRRAGWVTTLCAVEVSSRSLSPSQCGVC